MFAADIKKLGKTASCLLMIRVEIARIDAHLVHIRCHRYGCLRTEMYVRNYRHAYAFAPQSLPDAPDVRDIVQTGDCDAYDFRPGLRHLAALPERGSLIGSMGVTHGLDGYRASATYCHIADSDGCGNLVGVHHFFLELAGL